MPPFVGLASTLTVPSGLKHAVYVAPPEDTLTVRGLLVTLSFQAEKIHALEAVAVISTFEPSG